MPLSNLSRVEKEHQNGPVTLSRNEPPVINIITQGSIRHGNVAEQHNLQKRNGISWAEFVFQVFQARPFSLFPVPSKMSDICPALWDLSVLASCIPTQCGYFRGATNTSRKKEKSSSNRYFR
ncbi:hypothetical protein U1Q18_049550 [Sarracenia purpurea var. burkii]